MKLANVDRAVIQKEKIQDYLLSQSHPIGRFKAQFFRSLGYSSDTWELIEAEIRGLLGNEAQEGGETEYGNKYEIRGEISGRTGRKEEIVTAWIVLKGEDFPRFITAYPGDK